MSFYWQLQGSINQNINSDVYDIDLEANESNGMIQRLQNSGKKVICYFSAGTYEDWRSDANQFNNSDLGSLLANWPGERWLDIRKNSVRMIMANRIQRAVVAGCDAVEPDNLDGYQNNNGLGLSANDQINYLHWLSGYAHSVGISIGLKNALDIIDRGSLEQHFDWVLAEQCYQYNECNILQRFSAMGKAVFIAEYSDTRQRNCADANSKGFFLSIYNLSLDGSTYRVCN